MVKSKVEQKKFMLVNVAWNHNKWARLQPNPALGFGFTKDPEEAAFTPHEALNFDFLKKGIDTKDTVFGYFKTGIDKIGGVPRKFADGGIIIFWSKNSDNKKGYFIGVYGKARALDEVRKYNYLGFKNAEFLANIQGDKKLSCLFPCPVKDSAYKTI